MMIRMRRGILWGEGAWWGMEGVEGRGGGAGEGRNRDGGRRAKGVVGRGKGCFGRRDGELGQGGGGRKGEGWKGVGVWRGGCPSPVRWPGEGPDAACQGSDREEEAGEAKEKEGITRSTMRMRLGQ